MKILITGGSGFLGSRLIPYLVGMGHSVGYLSHKNARLAEDSAAIGWLAGDDGAGVREAFAAFSPDVVVHLAALYVTEHRYEDIGPLVRANILFGTHVLEAMSESGCGALVHAGSSWQHYGDKPYCPANLYAATKQAFSTLAEYYLDATGVRLLELHLYDSYGENDPRGKLISSLESAASSATPLAMSHGEQRIHLVHVDDLCRGFAMASEQVRGFLPGERRIYRLPSSGAVSLREVVATFNAIEPSRGVTIRWGDRPYRMREVFQPWEDAAVLPGWLPIISLSSGLRRVRSAFSASAARTQRAGLP